MTTEHEETKQTDLSTFKCPKCSHDMKIQPGFHMLHEDGLILRQKTYICTNAYCRELMKFNLRTRKRKNKKSCFS